MDTPTRANAPSRRPGGWATRGGAASLVLALWLLVFSVFTSPAGASTSDVVVIGDSILGLTRDELAPELLANGWTSHIEHTNGSGLTPPTVAATGRDWVSTLRFLEAAHDPDTVVIVLGTNDAQTVANGWPYPVEVAKLLAVTDARRVLWATCSTHTALASYNTGCGTINGVLRENDRIEAVPYEPEVTTRSDFGGVDSVHPGPGGQQAFADLLAQWVGSPK